MSKYYEFCLLAYHKDSKDPVPLRFWWGQSEDRKNIRKLAFLSIRDFWDEYDYYKIKCSELKQG